MPDTSDRLDAATTLAMPLKQELAMPVQIAYIELYELSRSRQPTLTPNQFLNRIVTYGIMTETDMLTRGRHKNKTCAPA